MNKNSLSIVIPCYNEEKRLPLDEFHSFIETHPDVRLCFVNDGSTDHTLEVIRELKRDSPEIVDIVSYEKNAGKADAVRKGIHYCNGNYKHSCIAYLDADLSASLQECIRLKKYLNETVQFCFGSRMMRIGSVIERQKIRFLIGRVIATCISMMLNLKVYDTQCGCKVFTREASYSLFAEPFVSIWLFDVELFFRYIALYKRKDIEEKMLEVPLARWIDRGESKVKKTYFLKLWLDLYRIKKQYKNDNYQI